MPHKFTLRQSGQRMMTVHLAYHVSEQAVQAVAQRMGVTVETAARRVRETLESEACDHLGWYGFYVDPEKKLYMTHGDDVSTSKKADMDEHNPKIGRDEWIPTSGPWHEEG